MFLKRFSSVTRDTKIEVDLPNRVNPGHYPRFVSMAVPDGRTFVSWLDPKSMPGKRLRNLDSSLYCTPNNEDMLFLLLELHVREIVRKVDAFRQSRKLSVDGEIVLQVLLDNAEKNRLQRVH